MNVIEKGKRYPLKKYCYTVILLRLVKIFSSKEQ